MSIKLKNINVVTVYYGINCFISAPAIFPMAFNLLKPFLSEDTKKKIYVLGGKPLPTLFVLIHANHNRVAQKLTGISLELMIV